MSQAFESALFNLLKKIDGTIPDTVEDRVKVFIAGGAAVHFYTGYRISGDLDASFSRRLALSDDTQVAYKNEAGENVLLYLDMQYSTSFALIHEDHKDDSRPDSLTTSRLRHLDVRYLSPVDLAVSKIARLEQHDREDIIELARRGMIDAQSVQKRANEALSNFVGYVDRLKTSIDIACNDIESVQSATPAQRPGP
jgi:hypothetical protein